MAFSITPNCPLITIEQYIRASEANVLRKLLYIVVTTNLTHYILYYFHISDTDGRVQCPDPLLPGLDLKDITRNSMRSSTTFSCSIGDNVAKTVENQGLSAIFRLFYLDSKAKTCPLEHLG